MSRLVKNGRMQAYPSLEIAMPEPSRSTDCATPAPDANKQALHLLLGAQRMMLEEVAFTACAALERIRSEVHLFGEFATKLAEAHSVNDLNAMAWECGNHQLEFMRRECDRQLRLGERLIEATSSLWHNGRNAGAA
jgi:hypothetical protein